MRALVWFREDLRIHDHTALSNATREHDQVIGLFIIDQSFWTKHDMAERRIDFIFRGLNELEAELNKLNIPLLIQTISDTSRIPETLISLMIKHQANALYFNKQYEVNELKRDHQVVQHLEKHQITCRVYDDQLILPPNQIKSTQGDCFKVFTAYKRAWHKYFLDHNGIRLLPKIKAQAPFKLNISAEHPSIPRSDQLLWPAGERQAIKQLNSFIEDKLSKYKQNRDFPAIDGTSKLSPYLSTGMISPRQCFLSAYNANKQELDTGNQGAVTWMSELIWRDFYKQILISVPRVSMHQPYLTYTDKIPWSHNIRHLNAWKSGQTGVPIVDAAMRQLNQTGWMHNRLRMVTAMFLSKNLLLDWRLGEQYFIQQLIDGDLAANNGGWQWSASTGTDAAPYFRIFNPVRQSERFDPDGNFIRQYCPELANLNNKVIHDPHTRHVSGETLSYPKPIIDIDQTRKRAIELFKKYSH